MVNTSIKWDSAYDIGRKSEERLGKIVSYMENPATVLDLGANAGLFSYGLADAGFDVTAVEPPNGKVFDNERVSEHRTWVQSPEDLPEEYFDYALVLSVLHHIPQWKSILDQVLATTYRAVFVEVPAPAEQHAKWHGSRESYDYVASHPGATVIGRYPEVTGNLLRDLWMVDLT